MNFIKYGLFFLFGAFSHYIIVMMYAQWLMLEKINTLGSGGPPEAEVFESFPTIFKVEVGTSIVLVIVGVLLHIKKLRYGKQVN